MAERASQLAEANKQAQMNQKFTAACQTKLEYSRKWMGSNTVSLFLSI
jgi:hypothetical protein